jgi:hypothetical protein
VSRLRALVTGGAPALVAVLVGGSWWVIDPVGASTLAPLHLALFVLAIAGTELLPIRQSGGGLVATSTAVVATVALLGATPLVVAGAAGAGYLLARALERRRPDPDVLTLRVLGGLALAGLFAIGSRFGATWYGSTPYGEEVATLDLGAAVLVTLAIVAGIPAYEAATRGRGRLQHLPRRAGEAIARSWLAGVAVASTAVLGGLAHDILGGWTLPAMLIPLFAARVGLEHFADASRAYDQTIRAMSRLPEQLGAVEPEHGVRVGRLARAVGLELGLDAELVADIEHAGHLHELGRIRFADPLGAVTREELAEAGASIVRETGSLDRVATIIAGGGDLRGVPSPEAVAARVVTACCEVDHYQLGPDDSAPRREVMVRLVRDVGDLEVVSALARVLEREPAAPVPSG